MLSSAEVLSTDEDSSPGEDDSDDELGRNLETLLRGKKTTAQLSYEQEEAERAELHRLLSEERPSRTPDLADTGGRGRCGTVRSGVLLICILGTPIADGDDTSSIKSYSSMVGIDWVSLVPSPPRTSLCAKRGTGNEAKIFCVLVLTPCLVKVGRHLIISRTFHDEEGREFVRDEVVKRPDVINAYVQLSNEVRSKFVDQDEETREGMKKMKRK